MRQDLLQIVTDYSRGIARTLALLETKFGKINYTLAKNEGQIPKGGYLDEEGKIPYNLHGPGVTAYFDGLDVTFDFNTLVNNHVGIDAWSLAMFTKMNRYSYPNFAESNLESLTKHFDEMLVKLERDGLLEFSQATNRYHPK